MQNDQMKKKASFKLLFAFGMAVTFAFVLIALLSIFSVILGDRDKEYFDLAQREVLFESEKVAKTISLEVAQKNKKRVLDKLKRHVSQNPNTNAVGVLDTSGKLVYQFSETSDAKRYLTVGRSTPAGETMLSKEFTVGVWTVTDETENAIGSIIVVKNIKDYRQTINDGRVKLVITIVICMCYLVFSSTLMGMRAWKPIKSILAASERVADGDLRPIDLVATPYDEMIRIVMSLRRMTDMVRSQVEAMKALTAQMSTITRNTEATMVNLASSASLQVTAVNETAATVEELEKAGQNSGENAKRIVSVAEKTTEVSKRGYETVNNTHHIIMTIKDASGEISEKSKTLLNAVEEVGTIIQSVNSIAEQSKILAVNASIEAAKAGKFGTGFAVVAKEIKALAQQSKDATLQITGTLTAVRDAIESMVITAQQGNERTEEGVTSITKAGAVMQELIESIRENSDYAKLISTNIQHQTVGLTQIASAIEEINSTALENQHISQNVAQGTKQTKETLDRLSDMVNSWITTDNG